MMGILKYCFVVSPGVKEKGCNFCSDFTAGFFQWFDEFSGKGDSGEVGRGAETAMTVSVPV